MLALAAIMIPLCVSQSRTIGPDTGQLLGLLAAAGVKIAVRLLRFSAGLRASAEQATYLAYHAIAAWR